jgi:hypothetical protein
MTRDLVLVLVNSANCVKRLDGGAADNSLNSSYTVKHRKNLLKNLVSNSKAEVAS